jgi:hypothetical protein
LGKSHIKNRLDNKEYELLFDEIYDVRYAKTGFQRYGKYDKSDSRAGNSERETLRPFLTQPGLTSSTYVVSGIPIVYPPTLSGVYFTNVDSYKWDDSDKSYSWIDGVYTWTDGTYVWSDSHDTTQQNEDVVSGANSTMKYGHSTSTNTVLQCLAKENPTYSEKTNLKSIKGIVLHGLSFPEQSQYLYNTVWPSNDDPKKSQFQSLLVNYNVK